MSKIKTEIIKGDQIIESDLKLINEYRKVRLERSRDWDHEINNHFHGSIFFLVKDENTLVSLGLYVQSKSLWMKKHMKFGEFKL